MAVAICACLALFGAPADAASGKDGPGTPVDKLHTVLLEVMKKAETMDAAARYARIAPVVESAFDLRLMTALSAGAHWRKASDTEKTALIAAFGKFSGATYASRFDGWSGQSFETLGVEDGPRGTKLVRTRINSPAKDSVPLTYVVRNKNGIWRIADILLNAGISEIAVRRSEYRSILLSEGAAGLASLLNGRARKLLAP